LSVFTLFQMLPLRLRCGREAQADILSLVPSRSSFWLTIKKLTTCR
jgi:hypothetical protein